MPSAFFVYIGVTLAANNGRLKFYQNSLTVQQMWYKNSCFSNVINDMMIINFDQW